MGKYFKIALILAFFFFFMSIREDFEEEENEKVIKYEEGYSSPDCPEKRNVNYASGFNSTRRSWLDLNEIDYCTEYTLTEELQDESRLFINMYDPPIPWNQSNDNEYFGDIYKSLYENDKDKLDIVIDSLKAIGVTKKLNDLEFAEMIVTFVQDIPYSYVFDDQMCINRKDKTQPCSGGNKFGLLTPVEFLYTLVGDCDTRAVLLYLILTKLNYDVAIVISYEYLHAMIAINLPYSGDFISQNGKKYYFWETTNVGWEPGILPPNCNNIDYWSIALN